MDNFIVNYDKVLTAKAMVVSYVETEAPTGEASSSMVMFFVIAAVAAVVLAMFMKNRSAG